MYFALLTFFVYLTQLTRDIYGGDIGDLVTASCVGGVAHPSGYPLFTLVGNFFCNLPIPLEPVTKVALISAIAGAVGVYFVYRFALDVTKNRYLSVLCSSILAFSHLYWFHAEIPEVFGLNNMFAVVLIYLGYNYYQQPTEGTFYRFAFFSGLALAHHQTILFLVPMLALYVFAKPSIFLKRKRMLAIALGLFIAGFTPYLYVPIAAADDPVVNWGNITNFQGMVRLFMRDAYGGFAPSIDNGIPISVKTTVARDYLRTLADTFSYQVVALAALGAVYLAITKNKLQWAALMVGFLLTGPFFVMYAASYYTTTAAWGIIERFYNLSFVVFVFFLPYGLMLLDTILRRYLSSSFLRLVLLSYFVVIPVFMFYYNRPKTDMSRTQIGNTLAKDILDAVPPKSVLFTTGDTTSFNLWYVRYVLKYRPDVDIINPTGVGNNRYLNDELTRYHDKHPKTPLSSLPVATITDIYKKRPVFSTYEDVWVRPPDNITLLPRGLVFEYVEKDKLPSQEDYVKLVTRDIRRLHRVRRQNLTSAEQNLVSDEIPLIYSNAHTRIGDFLDAHYKDPKAAETYYRLALWRDEESAAAYAGLALSLYKGYNDCDQALYNINQATELYPVWRAFHIQRYIIQRKCNPKSPNLSIYKKDFKDDFGLDIDAVLKKHYNL